MPRNDFEFGLLPRGTSTVEASFGMWGTFSERLPNEKEDEEIENIFNAVSNRFVLSVITILHTRSSEDNECGFDEILYSQYLSSQDSVANSTIFFKR